MSHGTKFHKNPRFCVINCFHDLENVFDSTVGLYEAKPSILLHTIPEVWHFRSGSIEKNFVIVILFAPCNDVKPKLSFKGTSTLKLHHMLYACNGYFIQDGKRKSFIQFLDWKETYHYVHIFVLVNL